MDATDVHLTIGEVAKHAGVGVETIRFYERKGLVGRPRRRPSGYREFEPEVVRVIRFIQRAKELGFSLREVSELLSLRERTGESCAAVRSRALGKVGDIDRKIAAFQDVRSALLQLSEACGQAAPAGQCPILNALDREDAS